jgi:hypothetical protein
MEQLKSSVRPYNAQQQHREDLGKKPTYYRVTLWSGHRVAGTTRSDATFLTHQLIPNARADLLNGSWEVHVEAFGARIADLESDHTGLLISLPGLHKGSNDIVSAAVGKAVSDTSIALIPAAMIDQYITIGAQDVGKTVDPQQLFAGSVRVVLKSEDGAEVVFEDEENWILRLLFVHKP